MLAVVIAPRGLMTSPLAEATLSRRLRTPTASYDGFPVDARSGRPVLSLSKGYPWQNTGLLTEFIRL
jgi:hypothetical protein